MIGTYGDRMGARSSTIKFGGLNTRDHPMEIPDAATPYARNAVSFPVGSARSRDGFVTLMDAIGSAKDTPGAIDSDLAPDGLALLSRISDGETFLVCSRGGKIYQREQPTGEWFDTEFPVTSGAPLHVAMSRFLDQDEVYHEAVLMCANGVDEPFVIVGEGTAGFWDVEAQAMDELTGASADAPIAIKITGHDLISGDIVRFQGITSTGWTMLNGNSYRIERISADRFYLLNVARQRVVAPAGGLSTIVSPVGTAKIGMLGIRRWPKGKYAEDTTRRYGYPSRWDDPDDNGTGPWGSGEAPDWPLAIAVFGEGLAMRAFAYGFQGDKSRVDVSMLGEPSNFLKKDVDAANEAAATDSAEDGGYFYVNRGDGDIVTGAAKVYDYYVFTKKRSLTLWSGNFGVDADPLRCVATIQAGNANPLSMGAISNELFFWDPIHGPKRLKAVQEYGDLAPGDLGDEVPDEIKSATPGAEDKIRFVHDRFNRCVMWFVPCDGSSTCNKVFVYYYLYRQWQVWDGLYAEMTDAISSVGAGDDGATMYAARLNGEVVVLNSGYCDGTDENDEEVPIHSIYKTKWFQMPDLVHSARPLFCDVVYGALGPGDVELRIAYDFANDREIIAELESSFGSRAAAYDTAEYEDATYDESSTAMLRYNFDGDGSLYQLVLESTSTTPWQVNTICMVPAVRGERK